VVDSEQVYEVCEVCGLYAKHSRCRAL